jgi:hypothetical protein
MTPEQLERHHYRLELRNNSIKDLDIDEDDLGKEFEIIKSQLSKETNPQHKIHEKIRSKGISMQSTFGEDR